MKATITFVGFGLLASSAAASLRQANHNVRIRAVSSPDTLRKALEIGLADEAFAYAELAQAVNGADLVLLCGPISHIMDTLDAMSQMDRPADHTILVSDIGSTKGAICQKGRKMPPPFHFVGGHPMAGSEKRSVDHHDSSLFENAYWILCPEPNTPPAQYTLLSELIEAVGAHPVILEPTEHDHIMARLSHVPQLVSTALASGLAPEILAQNHQHLAGRGFRDMTRIAASAWPMWRDIIGTNTEQILAGLDEMQASLGYIRSQLQEIPKSNPALQAVFEKGADVRMSLSSPGKGFSQTLQEVLVQLTDKPGEILHVVTPISAANINILEIELAKVREGIGGTLLLGFKTQADAQQSIELLALAGFQARLR